jgi:hypothetical protein
VHKLPVGQRGCGLSSGARSRDDASVFPGGKAGEPTKALWHAWHWVRDGAGLKDAQIYDSRRTFGSVGAGGSLSLPIIGPLVVHTQAEQRGAVWECASC